MARNPGYARIPNTILRDKSLPISERLLLAILKSYAHGNKTVCNPSQTTLADNMGLSERQVRRLLISLEDRGQISQSKKRGCSTTYCLLTFPHRTPASPDTPDTHVQKAGTHMSYENNIEKKTKRRVTQRDINTLITQFSSWHLRYTGFTYDPKHADTRAARDLLRRHPLYVITAYLDRFFNDTASLIRMDPTIPRLSATIPLYIDTPAAQSPHISNP